MCYLWQAAADFKASADSSKDHDDDEETDQSQAPEMKQDDSEEEDGHDGKCTNNYVLSPHTAVTTLYETLVLATVTLFGCWYILFT